MNSAIRHRLYLTARFCAGLLALVVIVPLATVDIHDYAVQRTDARCFEQQLAQGIMQARNKDKETVARKCTPQILKTLEARQRPPPTAEEIANAPPADRSPPTSPRSGPLSLEEEKCFWARSGEIVALSTEETTQIAVRCNVQKTDWSAEPPPGVADVQRYSEAEMIADLRTARSAGDKKLEEGIIWALKRRRLQKSDDFGPPEPVRLSTRTWRERGRWVEDAMIAFLALVPLITVVGLRRWLGWLTRPEQ